MAAQDQIVRTVYTVAVVEGGWAVEHLGVYTDQSRDKAEVMAAAHRAARAMSISGTPVQVRIEGETGYF